MSTFLSILPIIIALVLYFTGIPIAYALFAAALTYFGFIDTTTVPYLLMQKFITSTQSFPFLAIPFFIMCGSIMNYGGISARLMDFADALTGHLPGGLAQINVLLSMLMGGCSGSANADAAMASCSCPRWKSAATARASPPRSRRRPRASRLSSRPESTSSSTA